MPFNYVSRGGGGHGWGTREEKGGKSNISNTRKSVSSGYPNTEKWVGWGVAEFFNRFRGA